MTLPTTSTARGIRLAASPPANRSGAALALAAVLSGCGGAPEVAPPQPTAPGASPALAASPRTAPESPQPDPSVPQEPGCPLRLGLTEIAARILEHHNLDVAAQRLRVSEARELEGQAALWPNPYLLLRERQIRDLDPIDTPRIELELAQPFELGGKRAARTRLAEAATELADAELRALVCRKLRDAERKYVELLRLQRDLQLAEQEAATAANLERLATARLERGRDSRAPLLRFRAAAEDARLAVQDRQRRHAAACRELDELLGLPAGTTEGVTGDLHSPALTSVDPTAARRALRRHPRLVAASTAATAADRAIESAAADAWPDLTVALSYEREQATDDDFLGFYFKLPLPVWNRNQGRRAAAEAALRRAHIDLEAESLRLDTELEAALLLHEKAKRSAAGYAATILPALEQAHRLASAAFDAGKSSYLEVLEAHLALTRARRAHLDHLEELALAAAEIRYLATVAE